MLFIVIPTVLFYWITEIFCPYILFLSSYSFFSVGIHIRIGWRMCFFNFPFVAPICWLLLVCVFSFVVVDFRFLYLNVLPLNLWYTSKTKKKFQICIYCAVNSCLNHVICAVISYKIWAFNAEVVFFCKMSLY